MFVLQGQLLSGMLLSSQAAKEFGKPPKSKVQISKERKAKQNKGKVRDIIGFVCAKCCVVGSRLTWLSATCCVVGSILHG